MTSKINHSLAQPESERNVIIEYMTGVMGRSSALSLYSNLPEEIWEKLEDLNRRACLIVVSGEWLHHYPALKAELDDIVQDPKFIQAVLELAVDETTHAWSDANEIAESKAAIKNLKMVQVVKVIFDGAVKRIENKPSTDSKRGTNSPLRKPKPPQLDT